jgi:hypothetical protein
VIDEKGETSEWRVHSVGSPFLNLCQVSGKMFFAIGKTGRIGGVCVIMNRKKADLNNN